jgi:hypothetical protein
MSGIYPKLYAKAKSLIRASSRFFPPDFNLSFSKKTGAVKNQKSNGKILFESVKNP